MKINDGINQLIDQLRDDQSQYGSWDYPFEFSISPDAYMIILLRTLEINDEVLIKDLMERILSKQEANGAWKLFKDEHNGNLSATVEAYFALLYSGYISKKDERLKKAKRFILANGGIEETHFLTKVILSVTGQHKWPSFFPLPIELVILPLVLPVNFYSISVYGRANLVPLMIVGNKKFGIKTENSPDLSDLYTTREDPFFSWSRSHEWRTLHSVIQEGVKKLIGLPKELHLLAMSRAKQYMVNRIEPDGSLFGYFSSTFLMIFSLLSLGHPKNDPLIQNAVKGLYSMQTKIKGHTHMQFTTPTVWNTALISYALQEAGVKPSDPMIKKATSYLLERQHSKYGDWVIHNKTAKPGGWGFSNVNTFQPDIDDSTASLRAITREVHVDNKVSQSWNKGVRWIISMQNEDGGWPAFEKNTNSKLLAMMPIQDSEFILTDPSCADLTGRAIEFLGKYTDLSKDDRSLTRGIEWLNKNQEKNGSWYGRWGICYIYGTWAAVTGLSASGVSKNDSSIRKAVKWLKSIQNNDGGWGESCYSDKKKTYVPLTVSTLTHTAWALDALIAVSDKPDKKMQDAVRFLLRSLNQNDWSEDYPAGQGLAGTIYFHYHSYRYLFPLLALSHYQSKYKEILE
ncbi:squalene--hopene cyclase [Cytobacillus purgationiresistens]|uniref:Sporulenol synthase n=1 Tax=Cytobacillus purgationiresistens TaxID=863449 RepID=A0ABU0AMI0_9BACI|nr:squalene--hopene cyclase [Cytobacillus purgationiresistens]MDQ0272470.1 sporulenol synthase [Cytobacillus purgationiresistens]